jgi:hypothetical protein
LVTNAELEDLAGDDAAAVFQVEGPGELFVADGGGGDGCDFYDLDDNDFDETAVCQDADDGDDEEPFGPSDEDFEVGIGPVDFDDDGNTDPGTAVVTFCLDAEGDDLSDDDDVDDEDTFGCANEEQSAELEKTFAGAPVDIDLVFETQGQDPNDPCATGDTFRTNVEGDRDILIACTYDVFGNLVSTEVEGFDGGIFFVFDADDASVAPVGQPPTETGDDGTAEMEIQAINEGSDQIDVCLDLDGDGDCDIFSFITKNVNEGVDEQPECNDNIDNDNDGQVDFPNDDDCAGLDDDSEGGPDVNRHGRSVDFNQDQHKKLSKNKRSLKLRAKVSVNDGFNACRSEVPLKFQIRVGGEWITRKSTTTNEKGVGKVLIRDIAARYRAVANKVELPSTDPGTVELCAKASDTRRHGH